MKILITGATSGIGYQILQILSKDNNNIIIASGRNIKKISSHENNNVNYIKADLSTKEGIEILKEKSKDLDVLIYSAADFGPTKFAEDVTYEEYENAFRVNILGPIELTKVAIPSMIKKNFGRVIILASVASKGAYPMRLAYSASKHSLVGIGKTLNKEASMRCDNVKVYSVCVPPTNTERLKSIIRSRADETLRSYEEVYNKYVIKFGKIYDVNLVAHRIIDVLNFSGKSNGFIAKKYFD